VKGGIGVKKINGFTITKLSMSGFKCFEDNTTFDFGDTTFITAQNGQGKSSIADAIAFAFVGSPFFGDKGLDRLHNRNTDEMTVSVDFVDDSGETHNLTRTRKREITAISYDGLTARQSDLNSAFGDKDIFLSILNPLYFVNVLGDSGKGLLEKLLPVVSHEEIMAALSDYSRNILAEQSLSSPEMFIKNRRAELKELENDLIGYRSQKELLDHQRKERADNIDKLRADINTVTAEIAELTAIRDNGRNIAAEESALGELRKRRAELLSDAANKTADKAIQGLMCEIKEAEKFIVKLEAKAYKSSYAKQIAEAEAKLKVLYSEHQNLKETVSRIGSDFQCPLCMIKMTDDEAGTVKADLQQRLAALVADGKTAKNNLTEIMGQDSTAKREFEEQKTTTLTSEREKLAELNQKLQELNVTRELDSEDYGERLTALEAQIAEQESQLTHGNLTPEQLARFAELEQSKKDCETQIKTLSAVTDSDYTTIIAETDAEIIKVKILINEAIQYMAKRIELMLGGLNMTSTEIVLTEIIKTTGEVKDCFRFSYDGRDYKCLSLSEKVRAGLDICTLIQRLSGRNYPIFVDNGESICTFGNVQLTGQVMIARVVNGQGLQITHKNRQQTKIAA
jgi:DNA repair exonuclease SbcCD ATPase subunit